MVEETSKRNSLEIHDADLGAPKAELIKEDDDEDDTEEEEDDKESPRD